MAQTQIDFTVPTTNNDGSPITESLTYTAFIDTVNPPVKSFVISTGATITSGVLTVTFAQLGFIPVPGTDYFADAVASDADGSSLPSNVFAFKYEVVPNAPTGFLVR